MARLGDICTINPKSPGFQDKLIVSFIPMTKVGENGEFDPSERKTYQEVKKGFTYFQNGDVLFAKITPCMENGKGAIAQSLENGIGFGSTEFHVLRPLPEYVTSEWLFYFLSWSAFRKEAEKNMTGSAGQKRVPKSFLAEYVVDVPNLSTQKKTTNTLDKICNLISLRKQQLAKLDELVKARFVEMFGDITNNPKQWEKEPLENHVDILTGFPFDSTGFVSNGIKICGGLIIMPDKINWEDCKWWPNAVGYENYLLADTDIVMALDRPWISDCFKIALVSKGDLPSLLIQRTARIRAKDMNQLFIYSLLQDEAFSAHCNVTGSLVPHISHKDIKSYPVVVPPIVLQDEFAEFARNVRSQKLTIQQSLDKLEVLKKALMQEYFG